MNFFFQNFRIAIISILFAILFSGCNTDDVNPSSNFNLDQEKIEFYYTGANQQITINTSGEWSASTEDLWVNFSPRSGKGNTTINIIIGENVLGEDREGYIYFTSEGITKTVRVTQEGLFFEVDREEIEFDELGTPQQVIISSNGNWNIDDSECSWMGFSAKNGSGENTTVTLTPSPYTERKLRGPLPITVKVGTSKREIIVSQKITNGSPESPELRSPQTDITGTSVYPFFEWTKPADPDGDDIFYSLLLSEDGTTWKTVKTGINITSAYAERLKPNTSYSWKVQAYDIFGGQNESAVAVFETGSITSYADMEIRTHQANSVAGTNPVHLVVMGDGFIDEDYEDGGAFDLAATTAIESFFSVEPYPTYREYFKVTKMATYSEERGATVTQTFDWGNKLPAQKRNTVFNTVLAGGSSTGINCDSKKVSQYVNTIPWIDEQELSDNVTILLIINVDTYAGTCMMTIDGMSISMCPMGKGDFEKVVAHECGGHGFGRLLDEYRYYERKYPDSEKQFNEYWWDYSGDRWSYAANISLTSDRDEVHWKHYYSKPGYEAVGMYEGAALYHNGVWRPEYNSCMNDNIPYFNAPSREAIVRRIMQISGKGFSYDEFYANDKVTSYIETRSPERVHRPLGQPILYEGRLF